MAEREKHKPEIMTKREAPADKPVRRTFPGPSGAAGKLRLEMTRAAFADLTAHAKESLDAEICGVLVGANCTDDEGDWVQVEAVIRGDAARKGSRHVTFTQETWNNIHASLERDHAGRRIVGWYHTHPGFGVEFSDMDVFIQRNFFPAPTQVGLVTDPLGGAIGLCVSTATGIEYLPCFWVDGREQQCRVPPAELPATAATASGGASGDDASLRALEDRIGQLVQALDEVRSGYQRAVVTLTLVGCAAFIAVAGYMIYRSYTAPLEPPKLNSYVPVPVQIGDRTVLLGIGLVEWQVPDELKTIYLQLAKEELERAARAAAKSAPTDAEPPASGAPTSTTNPAAPGKSPPAQP